MYPLGSHLNPLTNPRVEKLTQTHTLIEQKPAGFRVAGTHCHLCQAKNVASHSRRRRRIEKQGGGGCFFHLSGHPAVHRSVPAASPPTPLPILQSSPTSARSRLAVGTASSDLPDDLLFVTDSPATNVSHQPAAGEAGRRVIAARRPGVQQAPATAHGKRRR